MDKSRVEINYSTSFYQQLASIARSIFGWLPFSFGDWLYAFAGAWIIYKLVRMLLTLRRKNRLEIQRKIVKNLWNIFIAGCAIYLVFQVSWGINYRRQGIGRQLGLPLTGYDSVSLVYINQLLLQKTNMFKQAVVNEPYPSNKILFVRATEAYLKAGKRFPFLVYKSPSVKNSLWGWLGNYAGFTGYYNPFTGEAQVNTTVPKFLQGFITLHEIAHQLGYAKEKEASFVGYLAAKHSGDSLLLYSTYLDLFVYANRNLQWIDSTSAGKIRRELEPTVIADLKAWQQFNKKHQGYLEPVVSWLYGKYLQSNDQPHGILSYDEVLLLLIAYEQKYHDL